MLTFEIILCIEMKKIKCGMFSIIPHTHVKNEVMTSSHGKSQRETHDKDAMAEM